MTLTDEEAREIIDALAADCPCRDDDEDCEWCAGTGTTEPNRNLITLLEGRIGTSDAESRIKELEGALRPFIEPDVGLIGEPGTVGSVVTVQHFAFAARALKGTT